MEIKVGDTVRLRKGLARIHVPVGRQNNKTAKVLAVLGGKHPDRELFMDRDLNGCLYWNEADVEIVSEGE